MMRLLFRLVIFVLGLAIAALWFGQMHHLRAAATGDLPEWSDAISDGSGIRAGEAWLGESGLPPLVVNWQATTPTSTGFLWDIDVGGDGIVFDGTATLPFWPDRLNVSGRGNIDLAKLTGGGAQGIVPLRKIDGQITFDRRFQTAFIDAEVDAEIPDGLADQYLTIFRSLGYEPGQAWRIKLPVPLSVLK